MMLGYQATRDLKLQLNLDNLFDKAYVERVRQVWQPVALLGHRVWRRSHGDSFGDLRVLTAGRP